MTLTAVLPIVLAWIVAIASPGPDLLMILRLTSVRDRGGDEDAGAAARARGLAAALGIMTGNLLWMTGAALGLGAVVALFPAALPVLKILGGAFLVWMGVSGLRGAMRTSAAQAASGGGSDPSDLLRPFRPDTVMTSRRNADRHRGGVLTGSGAGLGAAYATGVATNLANPKALIFFTALFAPFMSAGWPLGEVALLLGVLMVIGVAWFCGFALLVTSAAAERWLGRHWSLIEQLTSWAFVLIGAGFLINGVLSLVD